MSENVARALALGVLIFAFFGAAREIGAQTSGASNVPLTREGLEKRILESSDELKKLQEQIDETEKAIKDTKNQGATLQRELQTLKGNVDRLNLSIQSDRISIQKLTLEITALSYDLEDIEASVDSKRGAIGEVLREIQRSDRSNLLVLFLRSASIADGVLEAQSLAHLNSQLHIDIGKLQELQTQYTRKLSEASEKKTQVSIRQQTLESKKQILVNEQSERQTLLKETKNQEQIYQQNLKDLIKRQQEIASEIEKIEDELRKNIDPSILPIPRPGVLLIPVALGQRSQDYGSTGFAQRGYRGKWHNGLDLAAPIGTPVLAAETGTVIAMGDQDRYCYKGAYGKYIVLKHENNLTTLYAHLSLQNTKAGQTVSRGGVIGYVGRTGYATGPHLHFTVFAGPTFIMKPSRSCGLIPVGGDMDPGKYL